ncbi:uncharacterized protein CC84DRAFT_1050559, partial [Paraphaeosphaeria sporulosa]
VFFRFWCRYVHTRYVGLDDWSMLCALVVAIGMGIQNGFHISWGTGRHGSDLDFLAFECPKNPSQAWSPTFPAECNNLVATYFSTASINILTDTVILVMPLRAFWQLQLHPRKRWALIAVFLVGGIAVLASIVRIYALYTYTYTKDVAYDAIFILLLSQIEVNVAIISASAPALRPLFKKTFRNTS